MSKLFVLYDTLSQTFSEPMNGESVESIQQFLSVLVNTCSNMPQHQKPEDFMLYEIGDYDEFSGSITTHDEKKIITSLAGLKKTCKICARAELEALENEEQNNG